MHTRDHESADTILDKRKLQALGVLLPVQLSAVSFFSGRHPLGRAGEGMRFLRTRPFESGHDNPRDIDKFSPPDEFWINEWEAESQASVLLCADVSGSMAFGPKAALRNLSLLQLTYSLWRAGDRVRAVLFSQGKRETFAERNLKSQLEKLMTRLSSHKVLPGQDVIDMLAENASRKGSTRDDLIFVVSDFCPVKDESGLDQAEQWRTLQRATSGDIVPVIVSFELATDQRGSIRLWDAERRKHRMTLVSPSRVRRINAEEAERVAGIERLFRKLVVDYLVLRREQDVYPELARLARWRRRRRT